MGQDANTGVLTMPVGLLGLGAERTGRATAASGRVGEDAKTFREMARNTDPEELRRLLQEAGAIDKARAVATKYAERAKGRLSVLPDSPAKAVLLAIADDVVKRRK